MAFYSIKKASEIQIEIKKSLFIGQAKPVENEDEAESFVEAVQAAHPQATHHCRAYIIGQSGQIQRFHDDGEPSGTAGMPILETAKQMELTNVCIVVTRYFGGIKLGAGGLVRAYRQSAQEALEAGGITRYVPWKELALQIAYENLGKCDYLLRESDMIEKGRGFTDRVSLTWLTPADRLEEVKARLMEITAGKMKFEVTRELFLPDVDTE